jgi:phosphatidylglycerophosphate synthase
LIPIDITRSEATAHEDRGLRGSLFVLSGYSANLLSLSRVMLGSLWVALFLFGGDSLARMSTIALTGALSDVIDGRVARWALTASDFGRWLDSAADIFFILCAAGCEVFKGAIPAYIPALIAVSFVQYVLDSVLIRGSMVPIRSRLGHWGGILNYLLVIVLAATPAVASAGNVIREMSPLIALFYLAAILERGWSYRAARRVNAAR